MASIRMQHKVKDYAKWKALFDSDPLDRKGSGVTSYAVHRPVDDQSLVMVDLAFSDRPQADEFMVRLHELWQGPAGTAAIGSAEAWVVETTESADL